jgi:D-glycero-alpha-D-manno-heptose 1-phosphate guanylyltransferase
MEAIILAGGFGTRLRPCVDDLPKPLAPIGGRPFLEYLLDYLYVNGVHRAIISTGYMAEKIEEGLDDVWKDTDYWNNGDCDWNSYRRLFRVFCYRSR